MSQLPMLSEHWEILRERARQSVLVAELSVTEMQANYEQAALAITELQTEVKQTAPDSVVRLSAVLQRPQWQATSDQIIKASRRKVRAVAQAEGQSTLQNLARDEDRFRIQRSRMEGLLGQRIRIAEDGLKAITGHLAAFKQSLEQARRHGQWLLGIPLTELRIPEGIARRIGVLRQGHYSLRHRYRARSAVKAYRKALSSSIMLQGWLLPTLLNQIQFELLKHEFYLALPRARRDELANLASNAMQLLPKMADNTQIYADLTAIQGAVIKGVLQ